MWEDGIWSGHVLQWFFAWTIPWLLALRRFSCPNIPDICTRHRNSSPKGFLHWLSIVALALALYAFDHYQLQTILFCHVDLHSTPGREFLHNILQLLHALWCVSKDWDIVDEPPCCWNDDRFHFAGCLLCDPGRSAARDCYSHAVLSPWARVAGHWWICWKAVETWYCLALHLC